MEHVKKLLEQNHKFAISGLRFGARDVTTNVNWIFVGYDAMSKP